MSCKSRTLFSVSYQHIYRKLQLWHQTCEINEGRAEWRTMASLLTTRPQTQITHCIWFVINVDLRSKSCQ